MARVLSPVIILLFIVTLAFHMRVTTPQNWSPIAEDENRMITTTDQIYENDSRAIQIQENNNESPLLQANRKMALVCLSTNRTDDIDRLKRALISLDTNMPQDNRTTPLLVFNEGNISPEQKQLILNTTNRPVHFPEIDFDDFPKGFDPIKESSTWTKRSKWGYQQMCRFWAYRIWLHPILDDYETYMRFDTDSCFTQKLPRHLPGLPPSPSGRGYVYGANYFARDIPRVTAGLFATSQNMSRRTISQ